MSSFTDNLEIAANVASVLTAGVAVWFFGADRIDRCKKTYRLCNYLKTEKQKGDDKGQRTLLQIVREVGLTESEAVDASFRCKHIVRRVALDQRGKADNLLLEYSEDGD